VMNNKKHGTYSRVFLLFFGGSISFRRKETACDYLLHREEKVQVSFILALVLHKLVQTLQSSIKGVDECVQEKNEIIHILYAGIHIIVCSGL
jgi:hypothetical protein